MSIPLTPFSSYTSMCNVCCLIIVRDKKLQEATKLSIINADPILKDVFKKESFKNTEVTHLSTCTIKYMSSVLTLEVLCIYIYRS